MTNKTRASITSIFQSHLTHFACKSKYKLIWWFEKYASHPCKIMHMGMQKDNWKVLPIESLHMSKQEAAFR